MPPPRRLAAYWAESAARSSWGGRSSPGPASTAPHEIAIGVSRSLRNSFWAVCASSVTAIASVPESTTANSSPARRATRAEG